MKSIFSALCVFAILVVAVGPARATVTAYAHEADYLTDIATLGVSVVHEGFEDDTVWGSVRSSTAPSITNLGITWMANNANSEVTTGSGPALTGNYGFYTLPHGDFDNGIGDGFVGTSSQLLYGVGGWIETNTPPAGISLVLDADSNPVNVDFGEDCDPSGENCTDRAILGTAHKFFGVISTDGFTRFDFLETEFTLPDEMKLISADDFSIAGDLVVSSRADFDADGDVDGDDFLRCQTGFGIHTGAQKSDGDYDNDGDVDGDDFLGWQSEFGSGGNAAAVAVPEPSSILLLLAALSWLLTGPILRKAARAG
jgi:hypothetical protein